MRSTPVGNVTDAQKLVINELKPLMNAWLRTRVAQRTDLANATILVKGKRTETSSALSIDFKVQGVQYAGSTEVTE